MSLAPFIIAFGDAPSKSLNVSSFAIVGQPGAPVTVPIAPPDDSVDSNRVILTGFGTINSFGVAAGALTRAAYLNDPDDMAATSDVMTVTKKVDFTPDASQSIILQHNPPGLVLLGAANRTITAPVVAHGEYQSDTSGNWTETQFSQSTQSPTQHGGQLIGTLYLPGASTITIPPGATRAWVRMWGGSGAAGAGSAATSYIGSAGTGAGGYLEKFLTGLTPGHTLTYTRGNGGVVTGGNGTAGTASTLVSGTQTIATLTANGSAGTPQNSGTYGLGWFASPGGTATGGDINRTGQSGGACTLAVPADPSGGTTPTVLPGVGGQTELASGVNGVTVAAGNPGLPGGLIIFWYNDFAQ